MPKKAPAIPLKDIMSAIDKKDRTFYNRLTAEQKKAFSAWMMMRYASSVQGKDAAHYIYFVNEFVNKDFSEVSKHPELQWLLLSSTGVGKIQFHPYVKPPNSKKKKNAIHEFVASIMPHLKTDEIELLINLNTTEELKDFARNNGLSDKDIKEVFK